MHYEIRRGLKTGKQLTTTQRTSGTFAEEPIVLGKTLRRGMRPIQLTEEQFDKNRAKLLRLLLSGSIEILVVNGTSSKLDYKTAMGISKPAPAPASPFELTTEPVPEVKVIPQQEVQANITEPVVETVVVEEPKEVEAEDPELESEAG